MSYPFHPLFRRPAIVIADQFHNGSRHLTLRSGEGSSFLVPACMVDPVVALVKITDVPRLSVAQLFDLRAFLDSGLACNLGEEILKGGTDGEAMDACATGSVQGAAASYEAQAGGADESGGAAAGTPDGGADGRGEPVGGRR